MLRNSQAFTAIDPRAAQPFWMSRRQINTALQFLPLLLAIWIVFLLGFKTEVNPFSDEGGYHSGGVFLANSLAKATFLQDAFDPEMFKYPGYYAMAGGVYFVFGEHSLLLRAFGIVPLMGLALVAANTASLTGGDRARNFAMLSVFFSPVLLFFSLTLLRDIYIVFGLSIVLHAVVAVTQLGLSLRKLLSPPVLLALAIIFLMRAPQLAITLGISLVAMVLCWALSFSRRSRQVVFVFTALMMAGAAYLARGPLLEIMAQTFFEGQQIELSTTQLSALSNFSFTSIEEMLSALLHPKFVAITLSAKLSSFTLGPHPFARVEGEQRAILDLFGNFQPGAWGSYQWEDVLLVHGLQWIPHFLLLPFLIAGLIGIWRYNGKALIAFGSIWAVYAVLTIFSGNETRWGLPIVLVYYVITAIGYGWYGGHIKHLWLLSASMISAVILLRVYYGFPVPLIVVPVGLFGLTFILNIKPIGYPLSRRHPSGTKGMLASNSSGSGC